MKKRYTAFLLLCVAIAGMTAVTVWGQSIGSGLKRGGEGAKDTMPKIAVAYVVDSRKGVPDADMFTHLIYSFTQFNDANDGVTIRKPEKLQNMVDLKKQNPNLKVILGIGGDKREGFSEMAGDKKKRKAFVSQVKHIVDSLGLDGVDLDWEFPTTDKGGHTATPKDDRNYVSLVKDLRKALGKDKWISYYSNNSGAFIDHKRMLPYVSYVHVSGYNLAVPKDGERGYHQSPLYSSRKTGGWCVSKSIARHIDLGIPKEKILMGIPFYGRGKTPFPTYVECMSLDKYAADTEIVWDDDAQAPYYADKDGNLVLGLDDERSIAAKFDFIRTNGMPGVFVWHYDSDYDDHRLGKTIQRLRQGK
ncbi:MAG: hypothetical protein K2L11_03030 [Muribaculaceae bacterium]|nr:hypothetical protein [Muribaculaceae bacterium]